MTDISKPKILILGTKLCYFYLYLSASLPASEIASTTQTRIFEPGKEYHVLTDNEAVGTKSFNVYVPLDYTEDRTWPVIFDYTGRGDKYNPVLCRGGRMNTCDRGAIIMGMGFLDVEKKKRMPAIEYLDYIDRELRSIYEAKELISKHLRVDNNRLFISGTSAGGWLASNLLEYRAQFWAGAIIIVAGRQSSASALTNQYSLRAFEGMPIFLGSSLPGSSHGVNHKWAREGQRIYKQRGAIVSFEVYKKDDWLVHSPLLRDWTGAYILGDKTDSIREKKMKWTKLTRTKVKDIKSIKIIEEQIATQLNKEVGQLTDDDLIRTKELSLMGKYISDITYLSKLTNLESLDISFTYVETVENLLNLKNLKKLNISGTHIKDIRPLKDLPHLDWLSMWNLWLDREQINELKSKLPNLEIPDYQWDLYEKDSIGRVVPKLKVKLN
ncbi:MAG: hypothetical protein JW837_08970 [Sedimentisphaerales bacterium]|nr:hypothetical protein [Sedimentisphaerales bacterium]